MQLTVLENAFLLKSLGWAIANSFWQIGSLWLLYQLITTIDKKLPALVKHHLGFLCLFTSFIWFVFTLVNNYFLLATGVVTIDILIGSSLQSGFRFINGALPFLSIIYLVILFLHVTKFTKALIHNSFLQKNDLKKAPIDYRLFATNTALHLGIKKKINVWLSKNVDVPCITGFFKPAILLPAAIISRLSPQQIESILLHELAHIKRNDYLINLFQAIIELVLFFNPFAILLSKVVKKERENCCDEWVITFKYSQHDYACALLILEEERQVAGLKFALAASCGKKNLLKRIKHLFNTVPQTNISTPQKFKLAGFGFLLIAIMFAQLPYLISKPSDSKARIQVKTSTPIEEKYVIKNNEISTKSSLISLPIQSPDQKVPPSPKAKSKKNHAPEAEADIVNAFVNEELIDPVQPAEPIISQVVEKVINNETKYFVKIEEEQSGKKQNNTYLFELNIKDGNTDIKPLIILHKIYSNRKIQAQKSVPDSLNRSKKLPLKKRITS